MTTIDSYVLKIADEPQPLLAKTTGTLLFEVRDHGETTHWLVDVDKGRVGISPASHAVEADATVSGERSLLDDLARGRANAMAAMLRGDLVVEGSAELLVMFQRIFPGPGSAHHE